ncbi:MAG: sugar transferase, partial [Candidatus Caldatribacterium sp.]|nr:sugar transferase [Candidatus Caldatribacterium sp.]
MRGLGRHLPLWDYGLSFGAVCVSFLLHFALRRDVAVLRLFVSLWGWLLLVPFVPIVFYALSGLYSSRSRSLRFVFSRLVLSAFLSFSFFTTLLFYLRLFQFPRLVVLFWTCLNFLLSYFFRLPFLEAWKDERIFVLYSGERGHEFFKSVYARETPLGVIVGGVDVRTIERDRLVWDLKRLLEDLGISRVALFLDLGERESVATLLSQEGIPYTLEGTLSLSEERHGQIKLTLADLLDYRELVDSNVYIPVKYFLDRIFAGLLLAVLSPLFAVIALFVFLDSPGPVFYWQERVGKDGKVFRLWKFRTMVPDAEKHTGAVLASKNDPRVTRVGKFLRRTRLDELPQLLNVLKGEMSLVGPRPERPEFVRRWRKLIPYYDIRLLVKPGITGWAQIRGRYDEGPETVWEKLEYDLYYLRHVSLSLDFEILVRTPFVMLLGRGAK